MAELAIEQQQGATLAGKLITRNTVSFSFSASGEEKTDEDLDEDNVDIPSTRIDVNDDGVDESEPLLGGNNGLPLCLSDLQSGDLKDKQVSFSELLVPLDINSIEDIWDKLKVRQEAVESWISVDKKDLKDE